MSGKTRLLYDAVFLKIISLAPQFNRETSVSDFEIALYSSIKFLFGSNLQGCLFHYRQSLYRKWQQLGLLCVKVKEVVSWVKIIFVRNHVGIEEDECQMPDKN